MSHPGSAPCPPAFPPTGSAPSSIVVVEILSIKPNTDLEGDDDFVPFYDNHADIYGFVTIDGETFDLPQIPETDFPHWEATGPRKGVFEKAVTASPVPIKIDIWEGDSGATGDDDPSTSVRRAGKRHLDFEFDLCSLRLTGDVNGSSQGILKVPGGSAYRCGDDQISRGPAKTDARYRSERSRPGGSRPDSGRARTSRLVARKGTVVMVLIANNHTVTINTTMRRSGSAAAVSRSMRRFRCRSRPAK